MDNALLKKAAAQSVALMMVIFTVSFALQQHRTVLIKASNVEASMMTMQNAAVMGDIQDPFTQLSMQDETVNSNIQSLEYNPDVQENIDEKLSDKYLKIEKPQGVNLKVHLDDLYMNQSIKLVITGMKDSVITDRMISRIHGNDIFQGEPQYSEITSYEVNEVDNSVKEVVTKDFGRDICHGITIETGKDPITNLYTAQILIELDSVYTHFIYEDSDYFYIDLRKPSEVFEKVIVIDAGHGGKDAGALSVYSSSYEKDINLDILLHLKELLMKENIKVYYTRTADDKVFLRPRVTLANAVDCDYFISIHCNSNEVTGPNGTEVLYYDTEFKGVKASELASIFADEISKTIPLINRGIVEKSGDDIFIMKKAQVPSILIEVGYMSNIYDMSYLSDSENRKAVAQGIYNGIIRAYAELGMDD